jgi:hypothetical protein
MKIEWHNGAKCYYTDDASWSDVENTSYRQFAACWWNREEKTHYDNCENPWPCETEEEADTTADALFESGDESTAVIYNDDEEDEV